MDKDQIDPKQLSHFMAQITNRLNAFANQNYGAKNVKVEDWLGDTTARLELETPNSSVGVSLSVIFKFKCQSIPWYGHSKDAILVEAVPSINHSAINHKSALSALSYASAIKKLAVLAGEIELTCQETVFSPKVEATALEVTGYDNLKIYEGR